MASSSFPPSTSSITREEFGGCIPYDLGIMIIDEDLTCLKLLQTILSTCHYRVATFSDVNEALQNLWERRNEFDLVMAEYKMIQMRGLELLDRIVLGVNTPVITMCSEDNPKILTEALTNGACFHITKPISIANLDVVWQKSWRNKGKLAMPSPERLRNEKSMRKRASVYNGIKRPLEHIVEEGEAKRRRRRENGKKVMQVYGNDDEGEKNVIRKQRLMWSSELHRRFLVAITLLGRDAIPSNILSLMNVEGLTIKQVATHLQKHRRRVENAKNLQNQEILCMKSKFIQSQSDIPGRSTKTKSYCLRTGYSSKRFKFPTTINTLTDKTSDFKVPKGRHTHLFTRHLTLKDQRPILPKLKNSNMIMISDVPLLPNLHSQMSASMSFMNTSNIYQLNEEKISNFVLNPVECNKLEMINKFQRSMNSSTDIMDPNWINTDLVPCDSHEFGDLNKFMQLDPIQGNMELSIVDEYTFLGNMDLSFSKDRTTCMIKSSVAMNNMAKINNGLVMFDSSCGFDEQQNLENKYWEVNTSRDQKIEDDFDVNDFLLDESFLAWMMNDFPK